MTNILTWARALVQADGYIETMKDVQLNHGGATFLMVPRLRRPSRPGPLPAASTSSPRASRASRIADSSSRGRRPFTARCLRRSHEIRPTWQDVAAGKDLELGKALELIGARKL